MAVRSRRLAGPVLLGIVPQLLFTMDGGFYGLIKAIHAVSIATSAEQLALFVGTPGVDTQWAELTVPALSGVQLLTHFVVSPEEELWASSSAPVSTITLSLSGFRLAV